MATKPVVWSGSAYAIRRQKDMASKRYKRWRLKVYARDEFACVACGYPKLLNAHHIKPYAIFVRDRYKVKNGQTLCEQCHGMLHMVAGFKQPARVETWH